MEVAFSNEAVPLEKGSAAPYSGILFDTEKANILKNAVIERDGYKLLNESYERSLKLSQDNQNLYIQQRDLFKEQNDKLATDLYNERQSSTLGHILWFTLGVVATGVAFYGVRQAIK